jgi:hypothetical protein
MRFNISYLSFSGRKILFNFFFFLNYIYYSRLIERDVKGHLESAERELDKLAAPFSLIKLLL